MSKLALAFLAMVISCYSDGKCHDSVELIGPKENARECTAGARLSVTNVGSGERPYLIVCTCGVPDGGPR